MGRGRQAHAAGAAGQGQGRRPGTRKHPGHSRATRKTSAGSHRHPHTRAVPRRLGRRPLLAIPGAGPTPRPRRQGRRAVHPPSSIHPSIPSIRNRSVFHQSLTPRLDILGTRSRARRPRPGPQRRHRLQLRSESGHDRLLLLLTTAAGLGEPGPTRRRAPTPPFPLGSHHGAGRAHTAHTHGPPPHSPDTRRGPAGPSPNSEGGGAGRSRQQGAHSPTAGPAHPSPPFPTEGRGGVSAHVLWQSPRRPLRTQEGQRLGAPVPQGSLSRSLEKAFSPRAHRPSPDRLSFGPTEATPGAASPQLGRRGLRYG